MTGPPDDPSDQPTQMAEYALAETQYRVVEIEPEGAPNPWYRNRLLLALWGLLVALLLALLIYGIVELSRGGGTTVPAPQTSSTTPTRSSTTSPSPTTTTPSTTSEAPPSGTSEQTPEEAPPPPANNAPAPAEPTHRHHLHIPSTITLPHTVITLPHGF